MCQLPPFKPFPGSLVPLFPTHSLTSLSLKTLTRQLLIRLRPPCLKKEHPALSSTVPSGDLPPSPLLCRDQPWLHCLLPAPPSPVTLAHSLPWACFPPVTPSLGPLSAVSLVLLPESVTSRSAPSHPQHQVPGGAGLHIHSHLHTYTLVRVCLHTTLTLTHRIPRRCRVSWLPRAFGLGKRWIHTLRTTRVHARPSFMLF